MVKQLDTSSLGYNRRNSIRSNERHQRPSLRARERRKNQDQDRKESAGGERVAEQRQSTVVRQTLRHNAGTNDTGDEQHGADGLRRQRPQ